MKKLIQMRDEMKAKELASKESGAELPTVPMSNLKLSSSSPSNLPLTNSVIQSSLPIKLCQNRTLGDELGKGNFGTVYKGSCSNITTPIAVKIGKTDDKLFARDKAIVDVLINAKDYPSTLIKYYSIERINYNELAIDMEYFEGNTFSQIYECFDDRCIKLDPISAQSYYRQLISGLDYLHNTLNIALRDIKPSNIMFSVDLHNPRVVFIDLDSGCLMNVEGGLPGSCKTGDITTTFLYASPEAIDATRAMFRPVDDWKAYDNYSLAMTFMHLLSGYIVPPSDQIPATTVRGKVVHIGNKIRDIIDADPDIPFNFKSILKTQSRLVPTMRLSTSQANGFASIHL